MDPTEPTSAPQSTSPASEVVARLAQALSARGLDLVQPLSIDWYNRAVAEEYRVPHFGRPNRLAVVIGNTRALWSALARARAADAALRATTDPVDEYCADTITDVCRSELGDPAAWLAWFSPEPPPRRVAMQTLAHVAGLASRSRSMLSVHPVFGPWIALRALVVIDREGPAGAAPELPVPCVCRDHCGPLFDAACAALAGRPPGRERIEGSWRTWLAVRDACPVGREHRYSDDQCRYHYTHERRYLPLAR